MPIEYLKRATKTPETESENARAVVAEMLAAIEAGGELAVRDYAEKFYLSAFNRGEVLSADGMKRAIELAHSKIQLRDRWGGIRIVGVHTSGNGHFKVGQAMQVEALVDLPGLDPKDVTLPGTVDLATPFEPGLIIWN